MDKKYTTMYSENTDLDTYDEALARAKRYTQENGSQYYVLEAVAKTVVPVPDIEVVKL